MSIAQRLLNIARAEINNVQQRISERLSSNSNSYKDSDKARKARDSASSSRSESKEEKARLELLQYYANLELSEGADWPQVKSAYRRLMRKYHPDRHRDNPQEQQVATELTQKLRVAYEALRKELKP